MRKQLLLSTAALLAGVAIASAQDMGGKAGGSAGGTSSGSTQMERGSAASGHEQGRAGQAQRGAQEQGKQSPSQQRGQAQRESTTGQAQQGQHEPKAQQSPREGKQGSAQESGGRKGQREQTTGQSPRGQDQMKQGQKGHAQPGRAAQKDQSKQGQRDQGRQGQDHTTGQAPRQQGQTAPQQSQSSAPQQGQPQQGQASGQTGNVSLTSQQRTRIQQTVLAGRNVPRLNSVNFALSTGTVVPTSVRVVDVGPELIEINPQWRGYKYFVVHDDIVIVDNSRKIVSVVPTGSSRRGARLDTEGRVSALNLSETQIREIQTVLIQKGFDIGRPDGRLGARTVRALKEFQRKQGLQATGRIDNQTVSALGVSNMGGAQGGATTGQGGSTNQGGAAHRQAPAQQNQGANQPSTSGQGNMSSSAHQGATEPSRSGQSGANAPTTSGRGGASGPNSPAQHKENQQSGGSK
jgi:peptidoglycan hydrolase-like protein with peptidoglycan-binding domain